MISIFPNLLLFTILAITILRILIGLVLCYLAIQILFTKHSVLLRKLLIHEYPLATITPWALGIGLCITGILITIGLYTQLAAIGGAYFLLHTLIIDRVGTKAIGQTTLLYIVMIVLSLLLLFFGPGTLALDLPL